MHCMYHDQHTFLVHNFISGHLFFGKLFFFEYFFLPAIKPMEIPESETEVSTYKEGWLHKRGKT